MVHFDGFRVSLVCQKLLELVKAPRVNFTTLMFMEFYSFTDILKVFENDNTVLRERLYDLLRNAMIRVTPEAVLLESHFPKVSFSGLGTTFLKLSSQALVTMSDSSPIVEFIVRTDCYLIDSSVYAKDDRIPGFFEFWNIFLKDDTEENPALTQDKLCSFSPPGNVLLVVVWKVERDSDTTIESQDGHFTSIKPDAETSCGIADRRQLATRTFTPFLDSCFESFGSLHPTLDSEVCREPKGCPNMFVGLVMQRY